MYLGSSSVATEYTDLDSRSLKCQFTASRRVLFMVLIPIFLQTATVSFTPRCDSSPSSTISCRVSRFLFLCCVCIFHAPCPFKFSLWSALCLPLSVSLVPTWFSPLCSSPSLPHLVSSLLSLLTCSSLVISVCVFSLCVSFTPCPVIVFVSPCLPHACAWSCL